MNHVFVVSCQFKFRASLNYLVELVSELRGFERACVLDVLFHVLKLVLESVFRQYAVSVRAETLLGFGEPCWLLNFTH